MPDNSEFPILKIPAEDILADEPMGTKDKFWVSIPGDHEKWLFKRTRESAGRWTGEHWAEKVAAEIADLLELPHAVVELAAFEGQRGSISRRFTELSIPGTALAHGNVLLPSLVFDYDPLKMHGQSDHTLTNILRVIDKTFTDPEDRELALFHLMGYLVLDALILNTDRHHENWALIRYTSTTGKDLGHRMAPTFDHASSLARNATPSQIAAWNCAPVAVARYARNAPGAIYAHASDKHGLNPIELLKLAIRMKPLHVHHWLKKLHNLAPDDLTGIMERVPTSEIDPQHKLFTAALLSHTRTVLIDLLP